MVHAFIEVQALRFGGQQECGYNSVELEQSSRK
jgi:hypothetical protein